mmetsp:Transcript_29932/g.62554  ORF Transcript_29932/g.62554 Transcript_29932/m.62554 type:complete len:87 (-) Transcript_29932:95-355(-)
MLTLLLLVQLLLVLVSNDPATHENYDKSIDRFFPVGRSASIGQFFAAVSPSNAAKRIGVPPLLRTGSATVAVPVSLLLFALAVSKL